MGDISLLQQSLLGLHYANKGHDRDDTCRAGAPPALKCRCEGSSIAYPRSSGGSGQHTTRDQPVMFSYCRRDCATRSCQSTVGSV